MIWNAINDPLFGYIQDNSRLRCCARRQVSILYGAPLYGLAFLLPWFPWRRYGEGDWVCGLHLIIALCAFDALLTFVLLAQCALFAESSTRHDSRLRLIKYNQVATLIGSTSVLFCGLVSDNMEKFAYFQAFTVLVAALATACMCCTGKYSTSQYEHREIHTEDAHLENSDGAFSLASVVSLTKQIVTEKNFVCFVTMNFFQVFHLAFYNNFMMIFADNLIPKDVLSSSLRSIMYGAGFICPQVGSHSSLFLNMKTWWFSSSQYPFKTWKNAVFGIRHEPKWVLNVTPHFSRRRRDLCAGWSSVRGIESTQTGWWNICLKQCETQIGKELMFCILLQCL